VLAFGSAAAGGGGIFSNSLVVLLGVLLSIFIFVKFCGWAKKFELSGGFKKTIFILTAVGLVGFNVLYSMGNAAIKAGNGWGTASIALLAALIWAFVFAFALMAETK
jgi:hypothetical protein